MTCREKMVIEHPEDVHLGWLGGVAGCPDDVGYLPKPEWCTGEKTSCIKCSKCWDREIPEEKPVPRIKDSGSRRTFESGAVRDIQEGKGRCDLMPLDVVADFMKNFDFTERSLSTVIIEHIAKFQTTGNVDHLHAALFTFSGMCSWHNHYTLILEVAKHFEEGAKKYGECNWQKGIPTHCYIDSAVRHYLKFLRGDTDEPHDRAFCWNIMCAIWTCIHKPEMNDYVQQ